MDRKKLKYEMQKIQRETKSCVLEVNIEPDKISRLVKSEIIGGTEVTSKKYHESTQEIPLERVYEFIIAFIKIKAFISIKIYFNQGIAYRIRIKNWELRKDDFNRYIPQVISAALLIS